MRWYGISHMPPFFDDYTDKPQFLSSLLRKRSADGDPITIDEESGIWTIRITHKDYDDTMEVRIDPSHGLVPLGVKWFLAKDGRVWRQLHVQSFVLPDKTEVPLRMELVYLHDRPPNMVRFEYANQAINPTPGDKAFRCQFPRGTDVDDQVKKKRYRVE